MRHEPMKCVNVMHFARQCEPRDESVDNALFGMTAKQLELVNELRVPNTFLLQYDTLCDERYVRLFKETTSELCEVGLWYEIVEPLTSACGMPYESANGWKWDWHIKPGFPMAYAPQARDKLIDEAMRKFKEVFGHFPEVVGSWLIDTRTACRLSDHYAVKALCICRDQTNTDAYSLVGGYFNGAYYPSRLNIFTPAQTAENKLDCPVLRLLGPSPIHNYDNNKFVSKEMIGKSAVLWTLEPAWLCDAGDSGAIENTMLDYFFGDETLNFGYAQIGQENSFADRDLITPLKLQILSLKARGDVRFEKMSETAERFSERFAHDTPASVTAGMKNWDAEDLQSVYYQCKNYVANLFRDGKRVFIRAFYLFDEAVPDHYLTDTCDSFYALYENLPLVDTVVWADGVRENIGLTLDACGAELGLEILSDTSVKVTWNDRSVVFTETGVETDGISEMTYDLMRCQAQIEADGQSMEYCYKGVCYGLSTNGCASLSDNILTIRGERICLVPQRRDNAAQTE